MKSPPPHAKILLQIFELNYDSEGLGDFLWAPESKMKRKKYNDIIINLKRLI